ncbi:hypothetical protein SDC9_120012 [bioreactor metagenome]|uniref:Uncharacterized protein n=1 Tax=bioreactor metagenome TaxID=1076179 RepID=A0A645C5F5_9ZZZZ
MRLRVEILERELLQFVEHVNADCFQRARCNVDDKTVDDVRGQRAKAVDQRQRHKVRKERRHVGGLRFDHLADLVDDRLEQVSARNARARRNEQADDDNDHLQFIVA